MKSILYSGSRSRILEEWRFVVETERGLRKSNQRERGAVALHCSRTRKSGPLGWELGIGVNRIPSLSSAQLG